MITIKRHPNLDNWINLTINGKLFKQLTSRSKAVKIAHTMGKLKGMKVIDLDEGMKHHEGKVIDVKAWRLSNFCHSSRHNLMKSMTIEESARYNELMSDLEHYDQELDYVKQEHEYSPTSVSQERVTQLQDKVNHLIKEYMKNI